ncbi:bifunctional diguanylate cyclase/phosphodiesterase [Actinoplanes sp. Pm04-4]|uniref:Bifunctional diguanylate cyclase/phosphodiesterase n=1 Tax=Paractinoplanes pyxinae TaxID=2997416 RepID=A0ABT4AUS8_9ACTN|nr:bifunctional diguanylate cyclase/phosphodiesterase [Actinoplanes pyxinae]MCY1138004.1 bifunctional diguanylate cyclase/phosphodiesterase [Actinoplanes pyxinae]
MKVNGGQQPHAAALVALCIVAGVPIFFLSGTAAAPYTQLGSSLLACLAAIPCNTAARKVDGKERIGWRLLAAGTLSWGVGNFYWSWNELVVHAEVLFPSLADVGYLLFPLLATVGLWLIAGWASVGSRLTVLLDGLIVACALFVIGWSLTVREVWEAGADSLLAFAVSVAYPVADIVMATVVVLLAARTRRDSRGVGLLLLMGLAGMTVSDVLFALDTSAGTYATGQNSDAGWFIAFASCAAAGWLATRRPMTFDHTGVTARWQTGLPYVPFGLAALVVVGQTLAGVEVDAPEAIPLMIGLLLILLRQLSTLLHNSTLTRRLRHQAYHDPLTGLGNRALFLERLEGALDAGQPVAIAYLDLDDFKMINDSLGHDAGDIVLRVAGERLRACFTEPDTVARFGGDEFAVLTARVHDLTGRIQRLLELLHDPVEVGPRTVRLGASVGIAFSDGSAGSADLRKNVDLAMYAAKTQGKDAYAMFEPSMRQGFDREVMWRAELQQALQHSALHVVFQPIVTLAGRRVAGVEALARWNHPHLGVVPPDVFIPVAERAGLIGDLGLLVLRRACAEFASWPGSQTAYLSVNVSPSQMLDASFPSKVAATLYEAGLRPGQLVLEVTENALADESEVIGALRRLREFGIRIAIDDFGTGYASLRYLHRFPADIVKVDRTYVQDIARDPAAVHILGTLWQLFGAIGLTAVAEGIEDQAQAAMLMDLGCRVGQGFLYGRPGPLSAITTEPATADQS